MISIIFYGSNMVLIAGIGFGKSFCFQAIPLVKYGIIVLVILLTITLMKDQVSPTQILK